MDADAVEIRVLGSLIEKQRTTPDVYPLSLNALRLACNQATSRDPVVDYDEPTIRAALDRLARKGWTRLASGAGSRTAKYRHLLDEALRLDVGALALLAVLMLRGPQTAAELRQRSERLHPFLSQEEVDRTLAELEERELVALLPRRPGQKEQRYVQLLGPTAAAEPPSDNLSLGDPAAAGSELEERVAALEQQVAALEAALDELRRHH
ncbi:MAG TPA: DUF480 domain-containing protein [Gaiellaceae bacterium]|jgi:uncharacterized protein YceH (UPF0502 family)|nr:DUF480 domain-containing protein [Gaiellaceae bacterium]